MTSEPSTGLADDTVKWYSSGSMAADQAPVDAPAWDGLAAPSDSRRVVLVVAGVALAALVAVLVVGLAQTSSKTKQPSSKTRELTVDQLAPGDCLTGSDLGLGSGSVWPYTVTAVPCNQRHLAEITFTGNIWPESLATYPGDNAVTETVDNRCLLELNAYAGESNPWLTYYSIAPIGGSDWASGDRLVVCMAYEPGPPLRHSVKVKR